MEILYKYRYSNLERIIVNQPIHVKHETTGLVLKTHIYMCMEEQLKLQLIILTNHYD